MAGKENERKEKEKWQWKGSVIITFKKNVKKRIVWRLKENDGQIGMEGKEKKWEN